MILYRTPRERKYRIPKRINYDMLNALIADRKDYIEKVLNNTSLNEYEKLSRFKMIHAIVMLCQSELTRNVFFKRTNIRNYIADLRSKIKEHSI